LHEFLGLFELGAAIFRPLIAHQLAVRAEDVRVLEMPALAKLFPQQVIQVVRFDIVPLAEVVAGREHQGVFSQRPGWIVEPDRLERVERSSCRIEPRTRLVR